MSRYKSSELDSQRQLMARKRALARVIEIPKVKDWKRRNSCRKNPEKFCTTYFPEIFYNPFTEDQKAIVDAIKERIFGGGYQAIAAERGGGKSTISKIVAGIWAFVYGYVDYLVLLGANGPFAEGMLNDIKDFYEFSDLLCEDFPEICVPIRALEGAAQRAGSQTVIPAGSDLEPERSRIEWSGKEIVFPMTKFYDAKGKIIESAASGGIITTRGIDAAIRGLIRGNKRPSIIIGDDIETAESARSRTETQKRIDTLTSDVLGLAGPGKNMPVLLLGTILAKECLIDQFTDRKLNPAWHGIIQKRIISFPNNAELWQKYIQLRRQDQTNGDATARNAQLFYKQNRKNMDAGAVVSNKYRFKNTKLPDGSLAELSAIQACYNNIADMGLPAFQKEYQNEPPESEQGLNKISKDVIYFKLNGIEKDIIPDGTIKTTAFIDVHDAILYWSVMAWKLGAIGSVVNYGTIVTQAPLRGTTAERERKEQVDLAIYTALKSFRQSVYIGNIDLMMIDSGYKRHIVYQYCRESIGGNCYPSIGGTSRSGKYTKPSVNSTVKCIGQGRHLSWQAESKIWLAVLDADYFKQQAQNGFLVADVNAKGSISLYGSEPYIHEAFSEQICAEAWNAEKCKYEIVSPSGNHWLDTVAGNCAVANFLGITPMVSVAIPQKRNIRVAVANNKKSKIKTKY